MNEKSTEGGFGRNESKKERAEIAEALKGVSAEGEMELEKVREQAEEEMKKIARRGTYAHLTEEERERRKILEQTLKPIRKNKEDQQN